MNQPTTQKPLPDSMQRDNPVWRLRLVISREPTEIEVREHPDRDDLIFVEVGWHPARTQMLSSADEQRGKSD
jgi:hypothetical protein